MKKSELLKKILMVGLLFIFFSCDKDEFINDNSGNNIPVSEIGDENSRVAIFLGPKVVMGNGYAFSWIRLNDDRTPREIGIEMTPGVLNDLPKESDFLEPVEIPLPKIAAEIIPFTHIGVNWSPENFSDIENFKEAYFTFYYFTVPLSERMSIPAWSEETDINFGTYPPKNYMPANYLPLTKGVGSYAETGRLWLSSDPKSYTPLTHTFTFGTFEGKLVFTAPIVTFNFLKSGETATDFIPQPLYYQTNKPFPREYSIFVNNNENHCISLRNFNHR